ncbi:MAG: hypothetical protein JSU06_16595 [Actinobacteria bacterium]|nr:hypothetical protein [Actinomycetota bacterium]
MSGRRERDTKARLERLSEEQISFVRREVFSALYGRAGNLARLNRLPDPKAAIREVAALGRLAESLQDGGVRVPDRAAAEVAVGLAADVDDLHAYEQIYERCERAMWEHDAIHALVRLFGEADRDARGGPGDADAGGDRR